MNADAAELARRQHQLDLLIARDSEIGERAKLRVAKIYGPTATSSVGTYDFSDSFAKRDQVNPTDVVITLTRSCDHSSGDSRGDSPTYGKGY